MALHFFNVAEKLIDLTEFGSFFIVNTAVFIADAQSDKEGLTTR